jgi:hypothetical protein
MFRFTIRDVLWLTALVTMGAAWWLDRSRLAERLSHSEKIVKSIEWLQDRHPNWVEEVHRYLVEKDGPPPTGPSVE